MADEVKSAEVQAPGRIAQVVGLVQPLLQSASKLVFLGMAFGAVLEFHTGRLSEQNFMQLCGMAFAFYFSNKGDNSQAYLGK